MASKHTPGPWFLKREGTICDKETGQLVATTGYRVTPLDDEDGPNAQLIAAAPDLLTSLETLLAFMEPDSVIDQASDPHLRRDRELAVELAYSAMRKATGVQS